MVHDVKIRCGQPVYGIDIGVIMLDTTLPRPVGDIGNGLTFPFPVAYEIARGVTGSDARGDASPRVRDALIKAGQELEAKGVRALTTSCGLLVVYQQELVKALRVPVAASSLLQIPLVLDLLPPGQKVGVLTIKADRLGEGYLRSAGVAGEDLERVVVGGMEHAAHFVGSITGAVLELDVRIAEAEVVKGAVRLVQSDRNIGAMVLECTNMSAYSGALRKHAGVPVWDAVGMARWLHGSVASDWM